ncbi:AER172Cp [Eremothecium gossypii ATCC 10895]|uniref:SAGA complex subunit Spt7 n=1 Tax=Eremothecium gossypii (strain ATCC 10895 / CBS 109.51 / FGSC 9923 / NRRL Y-1056) TaxID=284811 RepID=Q756T1_EREGS|nr:AER172Cp [Eremothecium gossypii ATCC 10895]AAS52854.1 AER172Cp [Eremothecium gossypii ATCC 10895]AEY97161.1 FAER172Cp [Eremothecium gossypii FDAG1]
MHEVPIVNYQRSSTWRLLKLAESLHSRDIFGQYLSPPQLIVLNHILDIPDAASKRMVWEQLIRGNVVLNVEKTEEHGSPENAAAEGDEGDVAPAIAPSPATEATVNGSSSDEGADYSTESNVTDFSELDLEELKQNTDGAEFIGNLSLKIRYVLWQFAIDALYPTDHDHDPLEYVILGEGEDKEDDNAHPLANSAGAVAGDLNVREEDDDYDFDEDDNSEPAASSVTRDTSERNTNIELQTDSQGKLVVHLQISKDTLPKLRVNKTQDIVENFNKIYHNFENDKETLLKRLKLEENDKLLEYDKKRKYSDKANEEAGIDSIIEDSEPDVKKSRNSISSLPVNLGVTNLSLKHLLAKIQENKSKLTISDYELKHLIMDVRKNRSKWASDDKIGQEELYDACEKVVLELRNYTEHSTAFLNKVSKRDAPNYYQIIKKPMDLNTVLKKLKTFQYRSKQQFTDDIMLIWKNCLTYNSDPKHFLRAHAIAMQKKSQQLIPFIPDIVVRDRYEVEKELEKEGRYEEEDDEEVVGTGRKGGIVRRGIQTIQEDEDDEDYIPADKRGKSAPAGKRSKSSESHAGKGPLEDRDGSNAISSKQIHTVPGSQATDEKTGLADGQKRIQEDHSQQKEPKPKVEPNYGIDNELTGEDHIDEEEEEEEEEEEGEVSQNLYTEKDDGDDDFELSTWKNLTAKVRAEICIRRSDLFKHGRLNGDATAMLRNPSKMKEFQHALREYKEQQRAEQERKQAEQESMMKNGFGAVIKQENHQDSLESHESQQAIGNNLEKDAEEVDFDNSLFLTEYNVINTYPDIIHKGVSSEMLDKEEEAMVKKILDHSDRKKSIFLQNKDVGLTPKMNRNIQLIYEIRGICHKISLIRMLQNQSQSKSTPFPQRLKMAAINDDLDLDPVSQLETRNFRNDKQLAWRIMHKNVSKIAMSHGFESTEPTAINALTEIAGDYISNLIKSVKIHYETNSLNKRKADQILCMSLLENGINRPDDLYTYIETEFTKKTRKLSDIKHKLNNFLKDLLRPTLQDLSERNFEDESQSFLTGDFSTELTGDDFFGFKELGLEKEFGVLSNAVPLQLLTFQFRSKGAQTKEKDKKIQAEEFDSVVYHKITKESLDSRSYLGLVTPLLTKAYDRCNLYHLKLAKSKNADQVPENYDSPTFPILEDDELPKSKGATRARLPPTGKINANYKKKPITEAYLLPDELVQPADQKGTGSAKPPNTSTSQDTDPAVDGLFGSPAADLNDYENGFGFNTTSPNGSFSLSLPRVN